MILYHLKSCVPILYNIGVYEFRSLVVVYMGTVLFPFFFIYISIHQKVVYSIYIYIYK